MQSGEQWGFCRQCQRFAGLIRVDVLRTEFNEVQDMGAQARRTTHLLAVTFAAVICSVLLAAGVNGRAAATDLWGSGPIPLQVGGLVIVAPEYEGADSYRVVGAPFIAPAGALGDDGGVIQFRGPSDIRFRLLRQGGFEAGPVAGYRFGRDEDDGDLLGGLGDVDGGLVLGGFAAYGVGPLKAFASYQHQITGDETGGIADLGLEAGTLVSPRLYVRGTVGTTWASEDYHDSFFDITAAQSARSVANLARYDADAGFKDVYLSLNGDLALTDRWTMKLFGRYSRLLGDAADSPVVEAEDQFLGGLGLSYKFALDR